MASSESELQSEGIKAASRAFQHQKNPVPDELTLSNGIRLRIKPIPPMLLNSVSNSIPMPKVPKTWIEEKQRDEENPNHPDYIESLNERQTKITLATINLIIYACTEVIETPSNVWGLESDRWIPLVTMAGIDFDREDEVQRYITWMRCYAISTIDDLTRVQTVPMQLAGITEAEVTEVMESFRSGEERGADSELPPEQPSSNGNHVADAGPRPRSRARGA